MGQNATEDAAQNKTRDVVGIATDLAPVFADRAAAHDQDDKFVGENFEALKVAGLSDAGVPVELGGGGAQVRELCSMLRIIAQACGSTGLAFSMHTHQVAFPAWRWVHQNALAVEPLLRRTAAEKLILLSSGGSDWIGGSGTATRVDGGYSIDARKVFTSGAEAGDILMSGALIENEDGSSSVLHFGIPMAADEVQVLDTWRTLGMRGTGSNDVQVSGLFVPDAAVAFSRTAGEWHPVFETIATIAFPLIYSVYLGVAESARDIAIEATKSRQVDHHAQMIAGRMETALHMARLAHEGMISTFEENAPSVQSVNKMMMGRTIVAEQTIKSVELAMELTGGRGFYRRTELERRFRDIQAARYHPLLPGPQAMYAGAVALELPTNKIF